ncbi:MAG: DUF1207 domain-containing protein [Proteobacteria bacterium]|nr:DUF1207 domain-containing protein [Pseudomonadota bacterium]
MNKLAVYFFLTTAWFPLHSVELKNCRSISDNEKRLECYDHIELDAENSKHSSPNQQVAKTPNKQFPALIADLEEPRFFVSYGSLDFLDNKINAVLLGAGSKVKLKTFDFNETLSDLDFSAFSMIQSQFDVDQLKVRNNRGGVLINTDFLIGGELAKSFDKGGLRLKYSHRSVHLGDEFLIDNPEYIEQRLNLSYETLDLLAYRNIKHFEIYFGASAVVRSEPRALGRYQLQTGIQYRGRQHNWFQALIGLDLKSWQATNWYTNLSFKAGIEINQLLEEPFQLMFEYYNGKSPYGQFLREDLKYTGISLNLFW